MKHNLVWQHANTRILDQIKTFWVGGEMGLRPSEAVCSVGTPRHTRAVKFDGVSVKIANVESLGNDQRSVVGMCDHNFHVDVK